MTTYPLHQINPQCDCKICLENFPIDQYPRPAIYNIGEGPLYPQPQNETHKLYNLFLPDLKEETFFKEGDQPVPMTIPTIKSISRRKIKCL